MTAFSMSSPRYSSASRLIFWRVIAEICSGVYSSPSISTVYSSSPMWRLIEEIVRSGFWTP